MQHDDIKRHGDDAAAYGQDLQENREALQRTLDPDTEFEALEAAAWLVEREFDADVRVLTAEEADDVAGKAEPGRPAIDIEE
jgi:leucyl-tRNA synthetase